MTDLRANEVHLWWARTDEETEPATRARQFAALSEDERERQARFMFERHRRQFLVSHVLVRRALSHFAPVTPEAWRFDTNPHGRPHIGLPLGYEWLRFNLSHTEGLAVVAIARDIELGVDVEMTDRRIETAAVAARTFSPGELAQFTDNTDLFYDYWTLKEAYVKARGLGLNLPLDSFTFDLTNPERPRMTCDERCRDDSSRWSFHLRRGKGFRIALAWGSSMPMKIVEHEIVPLAD
jgi:4'-phosphopantetheinyl transferase